MAVIPQKCSNCDVELKEVLRVDSPYGTSKYQELMCTGCGVILGDTIVTNKGGPDGNPKQ